MVAAVVGGVPVKEAPPLANDALSPGSGHPRNKPTMAVHLGRSPLLLF